MGRGNETSREEEEEEEEGEKVPRGWDKDCLLGVMEIKKLN